jgi:hypothetical protein
MIYADTVSAVDAGSEEGPVSEVAYWLGPPETIDLWADGVLTG